MEQETMKCPYCGEEILAVAKKCKHCGEWLDEEQNVNIANEQTDEDVNENNLTSHSSSGFISRIIVAIICFVIAFLLFKFGSWNVVWGKELTDEQRFLIHLVEKEAPSAIATTDSQSFIATKDVLVIRIDKKFYGVVKNTKYFDSPIIQWGMLLFCVGFIYYGISALFSDE